MIIVKIQIANFDNGVDSYSGYEQGVIRKELNSLFEDFPLPVKVRVTFPHWKMGDQKPYRTVHVTPKKLNMLFREVLEQHIDMQCENIVNWVDDFPGEVEEKYPIKKSEELG